MGSKIPSQHVFDSGELDALELVLASAVATLRELGNSDVSMETTLRQRIFILARNGVTDPHMLRDRLLKTCGLDTVPSH